ncbi:TIGR03085 family metal-binding protein [Cellulomonas sp. KRMCY2]|uniref:TIGR03085 family metal-binding protein n=1 Tax=Cellulomonas sp. KRMCY2 TaxID=1304865 RepID=UPI00045EA026|nr:TIGR03085 family metal-binding protein [Cellulomonas sp. KRMCY2]
MPWHPLERAALADALIAVGPDAPTLCEGWSARHLAAHVVLRETAPLVGAGVVLPALAERAEQRIQALGDGQTSPESWARLVQRVRTGPPAWSPMRWAGDAVQLVELFVHTEDVRRGGAAGYQVAPRERQRGHDDTLWRALSRTARMLYRSCPVGVVLADGTGRDLRVRAAVPGDVIVRGPVGELLLHAFGRSAVAHVTVEGTTEAVASMDASRPR